MQEFHRGIEEILDMTYPQAYQLMHKLALKYEAEKKAANRIEAMGALATLRMRYGGR
jgi:hypothetical protein